MDDIQKFIGRDTLTVSKVMQKIDQNACGVLFAVDEQNVLLGCVSDKYIRSVPPF